MKIKYVVSWSFWNFKIWTLYKSSGYFSVFEFGFHKIFNFVPKITSKTYLSKPVLLPRSERDLDVSVDQFSDSIHYRSNNSMRFLKSRFAYTWLTDRHVKFYVSRKFCSFASLLLDPVLDLFWICYWQKQISTD